MQQGGNVAKENRLRALNNQVGRLEQHLKHLQRISIRYSWVRIAVFGAGLAATGLGLYVAGPWLAGLCALAAMLAFGAAVYLHRRVEQGIRRGQVWLELTQAQIARATLDWPQIPSTFAHRPRPEHPFEADLDLVGQRSLHRLLDVAVSHEGSQRLRDWLAAPIPDREETIRRQQIVRELAPLSLFRSRLILNAVMAVRARKTWRANSLVEWLAAPAPDAALRRWLWLFGGLAALNAVLFAANRLGWLPPWWQLTLVVYLGLMLLRARAMEAASNEALALYDALRQLRAVFGQLAAFSYHRTPHLRALCAPFLDREHGPARYLARLTRLVAALGVRGNPLLWFALNAVVPWDHYFAYRLNRTKAALADHAPRWMDVWFELEALSALANLAYLNPGYAFPELLAVGADGPVLQAQGLGHPLLPDDEKVCNDLTVAELGQVTMITGSNMAGKSVFLKTVGVNLALAQAGGPVDARTWRAVPWRLFTSMNISDSVTDGISYFYAEVKRLKALLDELAGDHPLPLLFCIDEIFRGTNNRERLIGSRSYVRALAGQRGIGFIATHDLELARLADEVPQVRNYHFRDSVVGERMVFDYRLRPGPSPTTNALIIMQREGLPVAVTVTGGGGM